MKKPRDEKIAFVGGGNMAEAILRGLLASGWRPRDISVSDPLAARRQALASRYPVGVHGSNAKAVANATLVILAVKPQIMPAVLAELKPLIGRGDLVVSIAAGVTLAKLQRGLAPGARVVRVMPNTPCLVSKGMSVLAGGDEATRRDLGRVRRVFETVGLVEVAKTESWLDAVTGLSGSGPAYVYYFADALIAGGVRAGLPDKTARRLVFQTLAGATEMLVSTGKTPRQLREAVSSPGGTTVAGLARMDRGRFFETVSAGVTAAAARSRQIARSRG